MLDRLSLSTIKPTYLPMLIIIFLIGTSFGFIINNKSNNYKSIEEFRLKENYKYINPLLECDINLSNFKNTSKVRVKIATLIEEKISEGKIDSAAVYYRDLNNGPWFGIDESTLFTPASLTKVPLMMTYFKKAEEDPRILNDKLKIDETIVQFAPKIFNSPRSKLTKGKEYKIEELINNMIIYSDNIAYITLKNNLSDYEFNKIFEDMGINTKEINESKSSNVLSIREYSSFFRILYNASYLNRKYSEKALKLLSKTEFNKGLVAGIPGMTISHKFGERFYEESDEKQLHDCGIVYLERSPYLICIMTRGKSFDDLATVIKDISAIVHREISQQTK